MALDLDEIDRTILRLLAGERAHGPNAEIGRTVGLSGQSVQERIRKLEIAGVVRGYEVNLNPAALGLEVTAFSRDHDPDRAQLRRGVPGIKRLHDQRTRKCSNSTACRGYRYDAQGALRGYLPPQCPDNRLHGATRSHHQDDYRARHAERDATVATAVVSGRYTHLLSPPHANCMSSLIVYTECMLTQEYLCAPLPDSDVANRNNWGDQRQSIRRGHGERDDRGIPGDGLPTGFRRAAPVIGARLAEAVRVSAPTVTQTLKRWLRTAMHMNAAEGDRAHACRYGASTLIQRRHRLAELLLTDILGFDWLRRTVEAVKFQHVLSRGGDAILATLGDRSPAARATRSRQHPG